MFWNLLAVFSAGLGGAGIALFLRKIIKRLPKWLIPCFAGIAMLAMQISSEYYWYPNSLKQLPQESHIIAHNDEKQWWRPWTYIFPVTDRFIAIDTTNLKKQGDDNIHALLYFITRFEAAHTAIIEINCKTDEAYLNQQGLSQTSPLFAPLKTSLCTNNL